MDVATATRAPVEGALVCLYMDGQFYETGLTDATGHAWIEGVRPGAYELRAVTDGRGDPGSFVRFVEGGRLAEWIEISLSTFSNNAGLSTRGAGRIFL